MMMSTADVEPRKETPHVHSRRHHLRLHLTLVPDKRARLAQAIKTLPDGITVDLRWQPYEPNPDMRPEGMNRKIYRSMKFDNWERSRLMDAQTAAAAHADGIDFDYDAITMTPNTFQAHWLMRLAGAQAWRGGGSSSAPVLPEFIARYPNILVELNVTNRMVDVVGHR